MSIFGLRYICAARNGSSWRSYVLLLMFFFLFLFLYYFLKCRKEKVRSFICLLTGTRSLCLSFVISFYNSFHSWEITNLRQVSSHTTVTPVVPGAHTFQGYTLYTHIRGHDKRSGVASRPTRRRASESQAVLTAASIQRQQQCCQ